MRLALFSGGGSPHSSAGHLPSHPLPRVAGTPLSASGQRDLGHLCPGTVGQPAGPSGHDWNILSPSASGGQQCMNNTDLAEKAPAMRTLCPDLVDIPGAQNLYFHLMGVKEKVEKAD